MAPTAPARPAASRSSRNGSSTCRGQPCARRMRAGAAVERAACCRRTRRFVHGCADADLRGDSVARRAVAPMDRAWPRGHGGRARRPGDEAHRLEPALARRPGARTRPLLDSPRPELRHRLWPVRQRDRGRDRADGPGRRLDARFLRALRRAPPRPAHCARPADRGERLEPGRSDPARPCDGLSRFPLLARLQPRRHVHRSRRRDSLRRDPARRRAATVVARVPAEAAGERLDRFLATLPEVAARAEAERFLETGAVRVDGQARSKSFRLEGGEEIELSVIAREAVPLEPEALELRIPYEDEHLLVVDKPAGLVVHPAPGHEGGTLVNALLDRGIAGGDPERPGIVHRLDRDTSGLLVVARSDEAYSRLKELVRDRRLERDYLALVRGHPRS